MGLLTAVRDLVWPTSIVRTAETRAGSTLDNPSADVYSALVLGLDAGLPGSSGQVVNRDTALRLITVFTCVRIIAEAIGALPLRVYRLGTAGRDELRLPADQIIWRRPNPEMTRPTFWEIAVGHCVLSGNAYLYKVRDGLGRVTELWPVDPRSVTVRRDKASGKKVFTIAGETYTRDDICHVPAFGVDGMTGMNPITQAREALGIALGAEQGSATFYAQGSVVSGILTSTEKINGAEAMELQRRWQKLHAGARNFHKVGVFGSGASWQQVGLSPADAQFLDARKYSVEEIARLFRVPPHMLGDVDRSTSWGKGLEEQQQAFVTYTLTPWLSRFEAAISDELLPVSDRYAKFDLDSLLRGKAIERAQFYHLMRVAGTYSKNDVRREEDMPLITTPDGDDYMAPLNSNVSPAVAGNGGSGGQGQDNQDGTANDGSTTGGE